MSPLLTIVIPAYNAADYLLRALESVQASDPRVEVLVIDDGSTDDTAAVAERFMAGCGGQVWLISKPNGGHGSAVNAGIRAATGSYLKVLDADDWFDVAALVQVLDTLERLVTDGESVDLLVTNYVYDKVGKRRKTAINYRVALPRGRVVTWAETRRFGSHQFLQMHALTYRTELLRQVGLQLPEHTFYVDMLFAFIPLAAVQTIFYLDVNLYHYFIGRADQSVNEKVMLKRIDQYARVNKLIIAQLAALPTGINPKLRVYLSHYATISCAVLSVLYLRAGTPADILKKQSIWSGMRDTNPELYRQVRNSVLGHICNLPGKWGRYGTLAIYQVFRHVIGFN